MQHLRSWVQLQGPKGHDAWLLPTPVGCVVHLSQQGAVCAHEHG